MIKAKFCKIRVSFIWLCTIRIFWTFVIAEKLMSLDTNNRNTILIMRLCLGKQQLFILELRILDFCPCQFLLRCFRSKMWLLKYHDFNVYLLVTIWAFTAPWHALQFFIHFIICFILDFIFKHSIYSCMCTCISADRLHS